MMFKRLCEYFSKLEREPSRLKMTETLAELFKETGSGEIRKICYLLQGRVAPLFSSIEFGMADKMVIKAIAQGLDIEDVKVKSVFKEMGDLGGVVEKLKFEVRGQKSEVRNIGVTDVYNILFQITKAEGKGSQEKKITFLADLIKTVDALSARFIVRIPIGRLRLGFSDMTILDGLSWMVAGSKEHRKDIERAYHVRPDLGFIAQQVKRGGVKALESVKPIIATPILMAKADRLSSAKDILKKIGKCAVEFKYDGLRLQVHYSRKQRTDNRQQRKSTKDTSGVARSQVPDGTWRRDFPEVEESGVKLFSRNLEDVTQMFPDIVEAVHKQVKAKETIFEGEVVAFNPKTGVSISFQHTMQRKRKYDIEKVASEIPVKLFTFELLYHNGINYINKPYSTRKAVLKKIIKSGEIIKYAQETLISTEEKIEKLFDKSINKGFEGIIAKRLNGVYQAGMRGWNWIKFKKAMSMKLRDTFDVVVMGYTLGKGKRTSFGVGQFLTGIYDNSSEEFVTFTKIGTGLTDEEFIEFRRRTSKLEVVKKPKEYRVDKLFEVDVWLKPSLVVEVAADEITRSQVHTAGRVMGLSKSGKAQAVKLAGYALRFPRLVAFRDDKAPQDITTLSEVKRMYKMQGK